MPRASSSPIADFRSLENGRLRTSTTTAILGTAPLDRLARSTMVGSRSGGRLSATNQSRSSSDFAAVLRPAPDSPVMITISGAWLVLATVFLPGFPRACRAGHAIGLAGPKRGEHCFRQGRPEAGQAGDLGHRSAADPADGAEMPQQRCPPGRPQARHGIELTGGKSRGPLLPVVSDRVPVRFVPH